MLSDYDKRKLFQLIKKGKFNESDCFEWTGPYDKNGYGITTYSINKKKKTWKVHRLIHFLINGEIPDGIFVCHACDNPKCFNLCHIFLGTPKQNSRDRDKKKRDGGLMRNQFGENNRMAKLNEITVLEIRKLYNKGTRICELARIFNLPNPTISKIVHSLRWKHI